MIIGGELNRMEAKERLEAKARLERQRKAAAHAREIGKKKRVEWKKRINEEEENQKKERMKKGKTYTGPVDVKRCDSCGYNHQIGISRDIDKLPFPWFGISSRLDNQDDAIRLDKILSFSAFYSKCNMVKLEIIFEREGIRSFFLSYLGYDLFIESLERFYLGGGLAIGDSSRS